MNQTLTIRIPKELKKELEEAGAKVTLK